MPRVHRVKKSRKAQGACGKCGDLLGVGCAYLWWKFRYGGKRKRCTKPMCWPKQSDLTSSDKLSRLYLASEAVDDAQSTGREGLMSALNQAAEDVREVAEEYRESGQNIEDGFGHPTSQSEELQERGEEVDAWADELESAASEIETMDADPETCSECDGSGTQEEECMDCGGEGTHEERECPGCDGSGETEQPCHKCDGDCEIVKEDGEPDEEAMNDIATTASGSMP
jgi:hypothetical protein